MSAVESAFEGMGVEEFSSEALSWLNEASHPVLCHPYLWGGFVPMVELLRYLGQMASILISPRAVIVISCGRSPVPSTAPRWNG
jgi:hypothetical protein